MVKKKLKDVFIETEDEKIPLEQFMVHRKRQYIVLSAEINEKLGKLSTYNLRKKTQDKLFAEVNDIKNMLLQIGQWYFSAFAYAEKEGVDKELLKNDFLREDWESEESRKKFEDFKLKMAQIEEERIAKAKEIGDEVLTAATAPVAKVESIVIDDFTTEEEGKAIG